MLPGLQSCQLQSSLRHNSGAGLLVRNSGSLTTGEALLRYTGIGAALETGGSLTISGSVIKNNGTNASSDGSQTMMAQGNWWGAVDEADVIRLVGAVLADMHDERQGS